MGQIKKKTQRNKVRTINSTTQQLKTGLYVYIKG